MIDSKNQVQRRSVINFIDHFVENRRTKYVEVVQALLLKKYTSVLFEELFYVMSEVPEGLKSDGEYVYTLVLVCQSLNVTLSQVHQVPATVTSVIMFINANTSVFITTIYATRPTQWVKNKALGIQTDSNSWLQYYTGVNKQIAA